MSTTLFRLMTGIVANVATFAAAGAGPTHRTPAEQAPGLTSPCRQIVGNADEFAAVQAFGQRVADYVALHRLLEGPLPPLEVSTDMGKVRAAMDALATRIRAARKDAHQGDLFTHDIARVLRRRIATCITPENMEAILADNTEHEPTVPPRLVVNMTWPEAVPFNFVPPQLIAALPPLPSELQYRIIGRSLVLWDHHANLIVDLLPGAFTS